MSGGGFKRKVPPFPSRCFWIFYLLDDTVNGVLPFGNEMHVFFPCKRSTFCFGVGQPRSEPLWGAALPMGLVSSKCVTSLVSQDTKEPSINSGETVEFVANRRGAGNGKAVLGSTGSLNGYSRGSAKWGGAHLQFGERKQSKHPKQGCNKRLRVE